MNVNPSEWLDINWEKNHARFYYSSSNVNREKSNKDDYGLLKPDVMIPEVILNQTTCGISGLKITESGNKASTSPGGYQYGSLLNTATIMMLTGMPSPTYKSECDDIINSLKLELNKDTCDRFYTEYKRFQDELWNILYEWYHPICNEYKANHTLLDIDFKTTQLKMKPINNNIKKLLGVIFYADVYEALKLSNWRENVLYHQLTGDISSHVESQYEKILDKIELIQRKLQEYTQKDTELLKHYSYLSTKTSLNVIINNVLQISPFKLVKPLHKLFKQSGKLPIYLDNIKHKKLIHKFINYVQRENTEQVIYYTEENLPIDVILGALVILKLNNPILFADIDETMFDIDVLDRNNKINMKQITQFCEFFRYYMNSENPIKYIMDPSQYTNSGINSDIINSNFKMEVISMTNYIWNIYSKYYNLSEAIVDGSSDTVDKLRYGPTLDESALKHIESMKLMKLLEDMGNKLKDINTEHIMKSDLKVRRKPRRTKKKNTSHVNQTKVNPTKDLESMKFMLGNKEILF